MVRKNNRNDDDVKPFQKESVSHRWWKMNHRHRIALKIDHRRGLVGNMLCGPVLLLLSWTSVSPPPTLILLPRNRVWCRFLKPAQVSTIVNESQQNVFLLTPQKTGYWSPTMEQGIVSSSYKAGPPFGISLPSQAAQLSLSFYVTMRATDTCKKLDVISGISNARILLTSKCGLLDLPGPGGIPGSSGTCGWAGAGKIGPSGWTGGRITAPGYLLPRSLWIVFKLPELVLTD